MIADSVAIPVIACGGAGTFQDFIEVAKETNASAIAAGNIFHFTELAYPRAKDAMIKMVLMSEGLNKMQRPFLRVSVSPLSIFKKEILKRKTED
jgi:tRNA U34 2-thiouridine synthase MnmA/TrmU